MIYGNDLPLSDWDLRNLTPPDFDEEAIREEEARREAYDDFLLEERREREGRENGAYKD